MAGQFGFQTTDPVPRNMGPIFDGEDVDELGLALCISVWERICNRSWSVAPFFPAKREGSEASS